MTYLKHGPICLSLPMIRLLEIVKHLSINYLNSINLFNDDLNLRYDLVDVTREALQIIFTKTYLKLVETFHKKNQINFAVLSTKLIRILKDLETLLATNHDFLLGNWIQGARNLAKNDQVVNCKIP